MEFGFYHYIRQFYAVVGGARGSSEPNEPPLDPPLWAVDDSWQDNVVAVAALLYDVQVQHGSGQIGERLAGTGEVDTEC